MADGPTIVAKFMADTSKMQDEVDKAATGAGSSLGGMAKKAAFAIGGAFAVDKVLDFGKASVDAAMADAEAQGILAQTLKNVTGATDNQVAASETFIGNLSKQTAIADDDLRPAMGNLVRGFGDAEKAQGALALATDISAGTGKDMTSVSQALAKAAMGSTGALKKLGIETENADGSAKSMDQIMQDLSATFAGSATASADSAAGKMRNAEIQFGEFQETIGTALLPVLADLGTFFVDTLIPALTSAYKWIDDNKLVVGLLATAITAFTLAVKGATIAVNLQQTATKIAAGFQAAWNAVMAANPIFLIVAAIALLVAGLIWAYNNVEWFRNAVDAVWSWISGAFSAISEVFNWESFVAGLQVLWGWVQTIFGWIVTAVMTYVKIWITIFTTAWDVIKAVVTTLWDWITTVFGWIVTAVGAYIGLVVLAYTTAWNTILAVVTTLWDWIQTVFGWIVTGITTYVNTWIAVVTGAWDLIKAGVTIVWEWIRDRFDAIAAAVHAAIDNLLGWVTWGWDQIKNGAAVVLSFVTDKWNAITEAVHTAINNLLGWVTWGWDQIKDGASTVWRFVTDKFQAIADFFAGLVGKIGDTARSIVDAIKGPINSIIALWNNLAFRVPEFTLPEVELPVVGKVGGQRLGGWTIEFPDMPALARGGVLTNPTVFLGGEAGTEIVSPEDLLRTIVAEESGGGTYVLNMYPRTADAADIAYGFRRLELLAGLP